MSLNIPKRIEIVVNICKVLIMDIEKIYNWV